MVLPLWRSMHSLNLMLPKEDRRALLLRLFDDDTPLVNTTAKREAAKVVLERSQSPEHQGTFVENNSEDTLPSKEEEEAIKKDSLVLGQEEQDAINERETYGKAGDEEDVMDTTV